MDERGRDARSQCDLECRRDKRDCIADDEEAEHEQHEPLALHFRQQERHRRARKEDCEREPADEQPRRRDVNGKTRRDVRQDAEDADLRIEDAERPHGEDEDQQIFLLFHGRILQTYRYFKYR